MKRIIGIRARGERPAFGKRPASEDAGYEYKARLRGLGLGGIVGGHARWRGLFALLLVVVVVGLPLFAPTAALAHSQLLSSSPPAGAILDTPPTEIVMEMSESVGLQFSSVI